MHTLLISTACLLTPDLRILLVRKRGSRFWMLPGGKLDGSESPQQALLRELHEELQWNANGVAFHALGSFENKAANEADTRIHAHVFYTHLTHTPELQVAAEIEALQWWPLAETSPATFAPLLQEQVLPHLRQHLR